MKIIINNMDNPEDILRVKEELEKLAVSYDKIETGSADISDNITADKLMQFGAALLSYGLELEYDFREKIILKIKSVIKDYLSNPENELKIDLSGYIVSKICSSYQKLNLIFLIETGTSIKRYYNMKKIEYAIELLVHYNLTLAEISYQLNYNSVSKLTEDFRCITGTSPDNFRQIWRNSKKSTEKSGTKIYFT